MEEGNKENRFTLEGSAHDRPKSKFVEERIEHDRQKPRIVIAVLSTLCVVLFIWAAISQYKIQTNKKKIEHAEDVELMYGNSEAKLAQLIYQIDSLQKVNLKLQTENDILAENSPNQNGIFFEVQLGSFSDFNMNQYLENLANLRQEQYDGRSLFLLGRFRSFNKAILFENDLKRMGIRNAFLVGRIDQKLVTYQEALEELKKGNK